MKSACRRFCYTYRTLELFYRKTLYLTKLLNPIDHSFPYLSSLDAFTVQHAVFLPTFLKYMLKLPMAHATHYRSCLIRYNGELVTAEEAMANLILIRPTLTSVELLNEWFRIANLITGQQANYIMQAATVQNSIRNYRVPEHLAKLLQKPAAKQSDLHKKLRKVIFSPDDDDTEGSLPIPSSDQSAFSVASSTLIVSPFTASRKPLWRCLGCRMLNNDLDSGHGRSFGESRCDFYTMLPIEEPQPTPVERCPFAEHEIVHYETLWFVKTGEIPDHLSHSAVMNAMPPDDMYAFDATSHGTNGIFTPALENLKAHLDKQLEWINLMS